MTEVICIYMDTAALQDNKRAERRVKPCINIRRIQHEDGKPRSDSKVGEKAHEVILLGQDGKEAARVVSDFTIPRNRSRSDPMRLTPATVWIETRNGVVVVDAEGG